MGVAECTVRRVISESLRYKSCVMRRGQFMSDLTKESRMLRGMRLLNKLKRTEELGCCGSSPVRKSKTLTRTRRLTRAPEWAMNYSPGKGVDLRIKLIFVKVTATCHITQ